MQNKLAAVMFYSILISCNSLQREIQLSISNIILVCYGLNLWVSNGIKQENRCCL